MRSSMGRSAAYVSRQLDCETSVERAAQLRQSNWGLADSGGGSWMRGWTELCRSLRVVRPPKGGLEAASGRLRRAERTAVSLVPHDITRGMFDGRFAA